MIFQTCKFLMSSVFTLYTLLISNVLCAQSPEISLREFASGQIKKGVRSIGMGGNGATWGNYSLVWKDSSTALLDAGATQYSNHNSFSFSAVGVTTPSIWRGLSIYVIALSQYASNINTSLKSPGLGTGSVAVNGDGSNQAVFIKAAMPLGKGFSFGVLLSYERSQFNAITNNNPANYIRYQTNWLPSGGCGITYQPNDRLLLGFRVLINLDKESRIDNTGISEGLNSVQEYRLGISAGLWKGALLDLGGNFRVRYNEIGKSTSSNLEPNLGFEQKIGKGFLALRAGLDESSGTAGLSIRAKPIIIDLAYVYNLGMARLGNLFGTSSHSLLATLVFNYGNYRNKKH